MISRGRLVLRTALAEPDAAALDGWVRRFETALREARRTANEAIDDGAPSTQASVWSASSVPGDVTAGKR
jgi:hypothetical protein